MNNITFSHILNSIINIGVIPLLISGFIYISLSGYPVEFYFNSIRVFLIFITMLSIYFAFLSKIRGKFDNVIRVEDGINQPILIISVFSFLILLYWRFL
jgi:hypothetical protein